MLGNGYGGGFIITPSIYVTKLPSSNSSLAEFPPGYGPASPQSSVQSSNALPSKDKLTRTVTTFTTIEGTRKVTSTITIPAVPVQTPSIPYGPIKSFSNSTVSAESLVPIFYGTDLSKLGTAPSAKDSSATSVQNGQSIVVTISNSIPESGQSFTKGPTPILTEGGKPGTISLGASLALTALPSSESNQGSKPELLSTINLGIGSALSSSTTLNVNSTAPVSGSLSTYDIASQPKDRKPTITAAPIATSLDVSGTQAQAPQTDSATFGGEGTPQGSQEGSSAITAETTKGSSGGQPVDSSFTGFSSSTVPSLRVESSLAGVSPVLGSSTVIPNNVAPGGIPSYVSQATTTFSTTPLAGSPNVPAVTPLTSDKTVESTETTFEYGLPTPDAAGLESDKTAASRENTLYGASTPTTANLGSDKTVDTTNTAVGYVPPPTAAGSESDKTVKSTETAVEYGLPPTAAALESDKAVESVTTASEYTSPLPTTAAYGSASSVGGVSGSLIPGAIPASPLSDQAGSVALSNTLFTGLGLPSISPKVVLSGSEGSETPTIATPTVPSKDFDVSFTASSGDVALSALSQLTVSSAGLSVLTAQPTDTVSRIALAASSAPDQIQTSNLGEETLLPTASETTSLPSAAAETAAGISSVAPFTEGASATYTLATPPTDTSISNQVNGAFTPTSFIGAAAASRTLVFGIASSVLSANAISTGSGITIEGIGAVTAETTVGAEATTLGAVSGGSDSTLSGAAIDTSTTAPGNSVNTAEATSLDIASAITDTADIGLPSPVLGSNADTASSASLEVEVIGPSTTSLSTVPVAVSIGGGYSSGFATATGSIGRGNVTAYFPNSPTALAAYEGKASYVTSNVGASIAAALILFVLL